MLAEGQRDWSPLDTLLGTRHWEPGWWLLRDEHGDQPASVGPTGPWQERGHHTRADMEASRDEIYNEPDPSNNLPILQTPSLSQEPGEVGCEGYRHKQDTRPGLKMLTSEHKINKESTCVHESLVFSAELYSSKKIHWSPNGQNLRTGLCLETGRFQRWSSYNEAIRLGPIQHDQCPYKEGKCGHRTRHSKKHKVKTK